MRSLLALALAASLQLATLSMPAGQVGHPYSADISAINYKGHCSFTLHHGPLPPGLTVKYDPARCFITIAGTPTQQGNYEFSVRVRDNADQYIGRGYEIKVTK